MNSPTEPKLALSRWQAATVRVASSPRSGFSTRTVQYAMELLPYTSPNPSRIYNSDRQYH